MIIIITISFCVIAGRGTQNEIKKKKKMIWPLVCVLYNNGECVKKHSVIIICRLNPPPIAFSGVYSIYNVNII